MNTNYNIAIRNVLTLLICSLCFVACELEDETTDGTGDGVNLTRDLVLYYTFDEGASSSATQLVQDHSGKNHNGVISGTPEFVADTPDNSGYALRLRQGDFVNIPTYVCADSANVSVNMWIKDFGQGMLFASMNGTSISTPSIYINSADYVYYQYGTQYGYNWSTTNFSTSMVAFQSDGWHMFTVTSANSTETIKLYIDGTLVDTQSGKQAKCDGTKMQIGGNADGRYNVLADPMIVDNCRIYKRCLNEKEVKELYKMESK